MRLLTTKDVAEHLATTRAAVLDLIGSGELPASNIGGAGSGARYRIDQRDLDRWLLSRRV